MADIKNLKKLREQTGISMMECKKALEETSGDIEKAKELLRERGQELIKEGKEAKEGRVASYIHSNGKIGALLELKCQTDFVAKSDEFKKLAHEICLHIAASKPLFVKSEDIPEEFLDGERKIYKKQFADSGKPEKIVDQIIEGKLDKYKNQVSLFSQPWVKDQSKTIKDLIGEYITKTGENIEVANFERYEI